jgi:GT2 family glycosyltransferase
VSSEPRRDEPLVRIVAVIWKQSDSEIDRFITAMFALEWPNLRMVLVNNDVNRKLKIQDDRVDIVSANENLGWTGRDCDFVLFMNTDVVVLSPRLVRALVAAFDTDERVALASPAIALWPRTDRIWYRGGECYRPFWLTRHPGIGKPWPKVTGRVLDTGAVVGCCLLADAMVFSQIGGFDERLFMYLDDPELSIRAQLAGLRTVLVDEILLAHEKPGRRLSALECFYFSRNSLILASNYEGGIGKLLAIIAQIGALVVFSWRAENNEARLAGLRGLRVGIRYMFRHEQIEMDVGT